MMESKYRVSLEVAKQIKEVGFPQEGCDAYYIKDGDFIELVNSMAFGTKKTRYAAPCVGRLGEEILIYTKVMATCLPNGDKLYECFVCYEAEEKLNEYINETSTSLADCLALMWIELKKRGLL